MRRPSLVGQLVRDHAAVVAVSCFTLVGVAWFTNSALLRQSQDEALKEFAGSLCHDVNMELESLADLEIAARHVFAEIHLENTRVELVRRDGLVIATEGSVAGWVSPARSSVGRLSPSMPREPARRKLRRFIPVWRQF